MLMNDEIFEAICQEIEESWQGLSVICQKHKVARRSFYVFKDANEQRLHRYACARERQLDYFEELLTDVSFNESRDRDVVDRVNVGGNSIARDRLKADTIKFILAKLRSHRWGNTIDVTSGNKPVESISITIVKPDAD